MKLPTLTQVAKSGATFVEYRDRQLFYRIEWDENRLVFPIPIDDAGEGSFLPVMKGINVLRWARKFLEQLAVEVQGE